MYEGHFVPATTRRLIGLVAVAVATVAGCSGSDSDSPATTPPEFGAIDGPATVDPSYDPFATVSPSSAP